VVVVLGVVVVVLEVVVVVEDTSQVLHLKHIPLKL